MKVGKKHNLGLTLIELIIATAIFGIVLTIGYSFMLFSNRIFANGEQQYDLQANLRVALEALKNDVRNVNEIQIISIDQVPVTDNGGGYKYLYLENNSLMQKAPDNGFIAVKKTQVVLDTVTTFEIQKENNSYILKVSLSGSQNGHTYVVDTMILLKNVKEAITNSGYAIKYK